MKLKLVILVGVLSLVFTTLSYAHIMCKNGFGGELCPHPHASEEVPSCANSIKRSEVYSWRITNNDNNSSVNFSVDGQGYRLDPGYTLDFTSRIGGRDQCRGVSGYSRPTLSFDRYAGDSQYTEHKFEIDADLYSRFFFWLDGTTVKFSSEDGSRR